MPRRTISDVAERYLSRWLEEMMTGQVSFGDLPLALEAFVHYGFALGRDARQPEIDQLERDVNRLYNLAFETDKHRRDRLEARLSQALEVATEEQWRQLEADLDVMSGRQINTGVTPTSASVDTARAEIATPNDIRNEDQRATAA